MNFTVIMMNMIITASVDMLLLLLISSILSIIYKRKIYQLLEMELLLILSQWQAAVIVITWTPFSEYKNIINLSFQHSVKRNLTFYNQDLTFILNLKAEITILPV